MLQAPRIRPCERGNVPAADAYAYTDAAIAGVAGVAVAAPFTDAVMVGVAAVAAAVEVAGDVDTADFGPPGGGRWCRGIAFRYSPRSGSCFYTSALRLAGRTGPTPVMSMSDSLSKSATLPPP